MVILAKKRYEFTNGEDKFVTKGGGLIEDAPEWLSKIPYFRAVVQQGDILEVKTPTMVSVANNAIVNGANHSHVVPTTQNAEKGEQGSAAASAESKQNGNKTGNKK